MDRNKQPLEPEMTAADIAATAAVPTLPPLRAATFPYHPGDVILPGYRLTKRLGSGGFGEVWRAEAPGGMGVAIKILANLGRREGGREYRALQTIKNIRHAHIVPLFGVWLKASDGRVLSEAELQEAEKRILAVGPAAAERPGADAAAGPAGLESLELIVAMGLGDQTLYDRLRESQRDQGRPLPPEQLLPWMQQAALALDHFNSSSRRSAENSKAVQHCDIKPQHMLLVGDVVQVCDFGLARAQGEVRATSNTMASLAYAAPEMVSPPYDPSPTTDQYSLAISYVEMRTGQLPYAELTPITILRAKMDGLMDLSSLAPAEARVIGRALEVDPAKRWQTCAEFVRALQSSVPRARESSRLDTLPELGGQRLAQAPAQAHAGGGGPRPSGAAAGWAETKAAETTAAAGASPTAAVEPARAPEATGAGVARPQKQRLVAGLAAGAAVLVVGGYAALAWRPSPTPPRQPPLTDTVEDTTTKAPPTDASAPPQAKPADVLSRAKASEERGDFAAAGALYAEAIAAEPSRLATELWSLQTKAADAGRPADCVPLLERLERLYAASPPPQVAGISRWDVVNSLAWYLATRPGADAAAGRKAKALAAEALTLAGADPVMKPQSLDTLAAAAARTGDTDEAVRRIAEAIPLVQDADQRTEFERRRDRYERGLPWDEP
jgi:serine/threonine protein kinase